MKRLLTIIMFLVMVVPGYAVDVDTTYLVDIENWVRDLLGGTSTSSFWTDAVIDRQVNLACREYALLGGIEKVDTVLTTNATTDYTLNNDVLEVKGVVRLAAGRKKMLRLRSLNVSAPADKGLGDDNTDTHPNFYATYSHNYTYYLRLDPPENESTADTILVIYKTYAVELTSDSIRTNVPYAGVPLVVFSATRNCLVMNRENPAINTVLPIVNQMYSSYLELIVKSISEPEYDPSWRNSQ